MEEYGDLLDQGHLPVARGLALTRDDLIRRSVIMALMCQGQLQYESINLAWLIDFKTLFAQELIQLDAMQEQGLVQLSESGIQVTTMGWFFVRGVAMVFDRYVQADRNRSRFSKII
jgi:oxygen-independent coproporphyrinogen-3 oxidase